MNRITCAGKKELRVALLAPSQTHLNFNLSSISIALLPREKRTWSSADSHCRGGYSTLPAAVEYNSYRTQIILSSFFARCLFLVVQLAVSVSFLHGSSRRSFLSSVNSSSQWRPIYPLIIRRLVVASNPSYLNSLASSKHQAARRRSSHQRERLRPPRSTKAQSKQKRRQSQPAKLTQLNSPLTLA